MMTLRRSTCTARRHRARCPSRPTALRPTGAAATWRRVAERPRGAALLCARSPATGSDLEAVARQAARGSSAASRWSRSRAACSTRFRSAWRRAVGVEATRHVSAPWGRVVRFQCAGPIAGHPKMARPDGRAGGGRSAPRDADQPRHHHAERTHRSAAGSRRLPGPRRAARSTNGVPCSDPEVWPLL